MRLVKRVTPEEKKKIQVFCQDHGLTESEFFGLLISRALASVSTEEIQVEDSEVKDKKITVRLGDSDFQKVGLHAKAEGFSNRTVWLRNILLGKINDEPVISGGELAALRESNRQISAIGRNLNQIARSINIEFRDSDKLKKEYLDMLSEVIEEHKTLVVAVISVASGRVR